MKLVSIFSNAVQSTPEMVLELLHNDGYTPTGTPELLPERTPIAIGDGLLEPRECFDVWVTEQKANA